MFVLGNAIAAIALVLRQVAMLYEIVLIGRVIISWVGADPGNPIVRILVQLTEPVMSRVRRFVPPVAGLDFSILVVLLVVEYGIRYWLVETLLGLANVLR
ncbi:YggT family protein [bacterium]|nr:YggT family protein [bacterium]